MNGDIVELGSRKYKAISKEIEEFDCIEDAEQDICRNPYPDYIVIDHELYSIDWKEE